MLTLFDFFRNSLWFTSYGENHSLAASFLKILDMVVKFIPQTFKVLKEALPRIGLGMKLSWSVTYLYWDWKISWTEPHNLLTVLKLLRFQLGDLYRISYKRPTLISRMT